MSANFEVKLANLLGAIGGVLLHLSPVFFALLIIGAFDNYPLIQGNYEFFLAGAGIISGLFLWLFTTVWTDPNAFGGGKTKSTPP